MYLSSMLVITSMSEVLKGTKCGTITSFSFKAERNRIAVSGYRPNQPANQRGKHQEKNVHENNPLVNPALA